MSTPEQAMEEMERRSMRRGGYSRLMPILLAAGVLGLTDNRDLSPRCDVGPEPHVFSREEGQEIARQIAKQRKAKRRGAR